MRTTTRTRDLEKTVLHIGCHLKARKRGSLSMGEIFFPCHHEHSEMYVQQLV